MKKSYGEITLIKSDQWTKSVRWKIECDPQVTIRLKRMFPAITKSYDGYQYLHNNAANCRDILWFTQRYPMDIPQLRLMKSMANDHEKMLKRLDEVTRPDYVPKDVPLAKPLREYQRRAVEIAMTKKSLLIGDDVGLGKTAEGIGVFVHPEALPALVVTLTHLPRQWKNEINDFAPHLNVMIPKKGKPPENWNPMDGIDGQISAFGMTKKEQAEMNGPPDVIVMNYHKLHGWLEILMSYCKTVIWDEVQELRHDTSHKYAAAKIIADHCEYRVGLAATPIYNLGGEIFNVMNVITPGALGTKQEFNSEWCGGYWDSNGRSRITNAAAFGSYMRENHLMLRRTREDVGRELPEITVIHHEIDADLEELNKIKSSAMELAKILVGQVEVSKSKRFNAGGQFEMIMRQATGIAKAPYVAYFVKMLVESGERVVLYGWHRAVYDIWMDMLKEFSPAMYTGSESTPQKEESFRRFKDGETPIFIMSLRSGAGLDGIQYADCRTVVFGELDWSPGIHEQAVGRVHRDGQGEPVMTYYLASSEGSDPFIIDSLGIKKSQIDGLRDPDKKLVEKITNNPKKQLRELAASYIGVELEEPNGKN